MNQRGTTFNGMEIYGFWCQILVQISDLVQAY